MVRPRFLRFNACMQLFQMLACTMFGPLILQVVHSAMKVSRLLLVGKHKLLIIRIM